MNEFILPDGDYLDDHLDFIPENKVIYKTLTGCGATHLELNSNRNSILIEPYIPVIKGKASSKVFPVHGGVHATKVVEHFQKYKGNFKFVSTPEGHKTIKEAAATCGVDLYKDFFLLVDECEKLIQDVNFRPKIISVMEDFFKYDNRSFISATPIQPSDPRFTDYGFRNYYIVPELKRDIKLHLRITNNLGTSIIDHFKHNRNNRHIIFLNSTERIASVIKLMKIENEAQVFCAVDSAEKLNIAGIANAQEDFDAERMMKYNFFTSRFFTAFDMILKYKPSVLIVSDVKKISHSAVDPSTDVIQIIGRARNGVTDITHITNIDPGLKSKNETEVREYLNGVQFAYQTFKNFRDTTNMMGAFDVLNDALKLSAFTDYISEDGESINHFMIDREVHINRIRGYYNSSENLLNAYRFTKRFLCCVRIEEYNLEDKTIDKLQQGISEKEVMQVICEALEEHFQAVKGVYFLSPDYTLYHIIQTHNRIYKYYNALGIARIRELGYRPDLIQREYEGLAETSGIKYFQMLASLKHIFRRVKRANAAKIHKILKFYFNKYNITSLRPTVQQLQKWFNMYRTTAGYDGNVEIKIWVIESPKF